MKQSINFLIFLVLLISSTKLHISARKLAPKEGERTVKLNNISRNKYAVKMGSTDYFTSLMGLEGCEIEDEECLKRRNVAEAHLDYIYTQQHNP